MQNIYSSFKENGNFQSEIELANAYLDEQGFNGISYNLSINSLNINHFSNKMFLEEFIGHDMARHCPLVKMGKNVPHNKIITNIWSNCAVSNKYEKEIMDARKDYLMYDGITISFKSTQGCCELIGLSVKDPSVNVERFFYEQHKNIMMHVFRIRSSLKNFSYPDDRGNPI